QPRADRERLSRPSRRYQEAILADKRNKMLTMGVTEDEQERLSRPSRRYQRAVVIGESFRQLKATGSAGWRGRLP
ncbi:hypothetical protein, partial [Klebsiella pneumoniae]|uniref:hypothetical protein n=1 Tax=Klebsiella pneumoniae TaxID=573 RepID=UPI001C640B4B